MTFANVLSFRYQDTDKSAPVTTDDETDGTTHSAIYTQLDQSGGGGDAKSDRESMLFR